MITTEQILTSPKAFGLATATPVQRALCRALDGLPLGDLANEAEVRDAFGGSDAVALLPTGEPPFEVHALASIRSAKTLIAAARIVAISQNVAVSGLSAGDIVRITVSALKLDGTRPLMTHLANNLRAKPLLRQITVGEPTTDLVVLRHPSGRPVEVVPTPIDRAGGSALSVWNAGAVVDEEPRQIGAEDGIRNWDEFHRAVLGRILPGGQFLGIGSPWAPRGPVFDLFGERFGTPSQDVVIFRAGGPAMNPTWWTPERCEALRRRDPVAWRTDGQALFADAADLAFFDHSTITAAVDPTLILPRQALPGESVSAGGDFAFRSDSSALAVVHRDDRFFRVGELLELRPVSGAPLRPSEVVAQFAAVLKRHGLEHLVADGHYRESIAEHLNAHDLAFKEAPAGATGVAETYVKARQLMREGRCKLPNHPRFLSQLRAVEWRPNPGGTISILLPRERSGSHCDMISAWVLGMHEASGIPVVAPPPKPGSKSYYDALQAEMEASAERAAARRASQGSEPYWMQDARDSGFYVP